MPILAAAGTTIIESPVLPQGEGRLADGDSAGIPANTIQHSVTGTTLHGQADAAQAPCGPVGRSLPAAAR